MGMVCPSNSKIKHYYLGGSRFACVSNETIYSNQLATEAEKVDLLCCLVLIGFLVHFCYLWKQWLLIYFYCRLLWKLSPLSRSQSSSCQLKSSNTVIKTHHTPPPDMAAGVFLSPLWGRGTQLSSMKSCGSWSWQYWFFTLLASSSSPSPPPHRKAAVSVNVWRKWHVYAQCEHLDCGMSSPR